MDYETVTIKIMRRQDDGTEELIKQATAFSSDLFIVANGEIGVNNLRTKDDISVMVDESTVIDQRYAIVAHKLCTIYGGSAIPTAVVPELICFTIDIGWEPHEKANANASWKIDVKKASRWLRWATGYRFEIRLRQHWIEEWTDAQLHAAILSQMLRINPSGDGSVLAYSVDFQDPLTSTFGNGYLNPGTDIPDVMVEMVRIRRAPEASGQIRMDELPEDSDGANEGADEGADEGEEALFAPDAGEGDE
jgi:hypothetical protein